MFENCQLYFCEVRPRSMKLSHLITNYVKLLLVSFTQPLAGKLDVSLTRYEVACCDSDVSLHQCRVSPIEQKHIWCDRVYKSPHVHCPPNGQNPRPLPPEWLQSAGREDFNMFEWSFMLLGWRVIFYK